SSPRCDRLGATVFEACSHRSYATFACNCPVKTPPGRQKSVRGGGENGAGAGGVLGDLGLQCVETGEFLFRPDEIDERDAQVASVKIDIDVEQVGLEPRHEAADRRAQTDVGDAVDCAAGERVVRTVAGDPHGIDPEGGVQVVV